MSENQQKPHERLLSLANKLSVLYYEIGEKMPDAKEIEFATDGKKAITSATLDPLLNLIGDLYNLNADMVAADYDTIRFKHEQKLLSDPDYKEKFEAVTIPEGRVFTVVLKCVDRYETDALMASMFAKDHPNVAGCSVEKIDYSDQNVSTILDKVAQFAAELTGRRLV